MSNRADLLAWGVAGLALVAIVALLLVRRSDGSPSVGVVGGEAAGVTASPSRGGPPDISNMSPRERAERLYDRTMMAREAGKLDSANFFATMAMRVYSALPDPTLDDHYDLGRLALVVGDVGRARAESDTILAAHPNHLLGLLLAEDAARARGDTAAATATHKKLLATAPAERNAGLPEYSSHATELTAALAR